MTSSTDRGRLRRAWVAAHDPVDGVPRWARVAALAVPLTVLPASLWRIPAAFYEGAGIAEWVYVVCLSIVSEVIAFTAVGLIARWGEVCPQWMPFVRGRRVPLRAAAIPAAFGALFLTVMWTAAWISIIMGVTLRGGSTPANFPTEEGGWKAATFYVCYLPLLLWGPLLAAATFAYVRRRRLVACQV